MANEIVKLTVTISSQKEVGDAIANDSCATIFFV